MAAFKNANIVYLHDLPADVDEKTLASLVKRGLIEALDEENGAGTRPRAWRLVR